jgi:hypothetical protein
MPFVVNQRVRYITTRNHGIFQFVRVPMERMSVARSRRSAGRPPGGMEGGTPGVRGAAYGDHGAGDWQPASPFANGTTALVIPCADALIKAARSVRAPGKGIAKPDMPCAGRSMVHTNQGVPGQGTARSGQKAPSCWGYPQIAGPLQALNASGAQRQPHSGAPFTPGGKQTAYAMAQRTGAPMRSATRKASLKLWAQKSPHKAGSVGS